MEKDSQDDEIIELTQRVEDSDPLADDIIELNIIVEPSPRMAIPSPPPDEELIELNDILTDATETTADRGIALTEADQRPPSDVMETIEETEVIALSLSDEVTDMFKADQPSLPDLTDIFGDAETMVVERLDALKNMLEESLELAEDNAPQAPDTDDVESADTLETAKMDRPDGLEEDIARALTEEDPAQMGDPAEKSVIEFPDDVAMALTPEDLLHGLGMDTTTDDAQESPHFPPPSGAQMEAALERVIQKIYGEKIERLLVDTIEKTIRKEIETLKSTLLSGNAPR